MRANYAQARIILYVLVKSHKLAKVKIYSNLVVTSLPRFVLLFTFKRHIATATTIMGYAHCLQAARLRACLALRARPRSSSSQSSSHSSLKAKLFACLALRARSSSSQSSSRSSLKAKLFACLALRARSTFQFVAELLSLQLESKTFCLSSPSGTLPPLGCSSYVLILT